jgi:aspartate/methionine/tyrosine aminotransferase
MRVAPFLLDRWLTEHQFADPPIEFDLAASTGPRWTWGDLLSQLAPDAVDTIRLGGVSYGPAAGSPAVREAVAEMAGVSPADVIVVTGVSEALWMLLVVAAAPGANVVLPDPGYPAFDELARHVGLELRHYHLAADERNAIDADEVAACVDDRTALVIVNTPHNPTGAVVAVDEVVRLRDLAAGRGAQLVVDEVYHPIYHGPAQPSAAPMPGVTTIGDLSKALCLSGLRIGWIIEHDRARFEQYVDARSYLTISNSPINEALAAEAIRNRDTILAKAQSVATANLAVLDELFDEHAELLGWVRPAGGLTAFPRLRSGADARPLCVDAAAAGVLVAPGDCFGAPSHFRIGFGGVERGFSEAVTRLGEIVAKRA